MTPTIPEVDPPREPDTSCGISWSSLISRARQRQGFYEKNERLANRYLANDTLLYEANYEGWSTRLHSDLERRSKRLLHHVTQPIPVEVRNSQPVSYTWTCWFADDNEVIEIIKERVWPALLFRLPAPAQDRITAYCLMRHLEKRCRRDIRLPFRFLDLPRELRDQVYELCVLAPQIVAAKKKSAPGKRLTRQICVLSVSASGKNRWCRKHPHMLRVNRQIRSEAGQAYYGKNDFLIHFFVNKASSSVVVDPVLEIDRWSRTMVRDLAIHLRDLRITINWGQNRQDWTDIHVTYSRTHGFQAIFDGQRRKYDEPPGNTPSEDAYVAEFNAKKQADGRIDQGEALIRFFTDDPEGLRAAYHRPAGGWVEEINANGESQHRFIEGVLGSKHPYVELHGW